jgi:hypothetical protein
MAETAPVPVCRNSRRFIDPRVLVSGGTVIGAISGYRLGSGQDFVEYPLEIALLLADILDLLRA